MTQSILTLITRRERGDSIFLKSTYLDNNGEECPLYATGWNDKKCKTIISNCGTSAHVDNDQRARTATAMDPNTKELNGKIYEFNKKN